MRRLSKEEVDQLIAAFTNPNFKARRNPNLLQTEAAPRRIAVENFLMSAPLDLDITLQRMNLQMDARSYGWSQRTIDCISEGLRRMADE